MSGSETPTYSLFNSDRDELNAQFSVEPAGPSLYWVVFESAGDTDRNRDYNEALEIALGRLGRAQATLTQLEVVSRDALKNFSARERRFTVQGHKLPLTLASVEDYHELRVKIAAGMSKTAQGKDAKKDSSGNGQKRLRLVIRFAGVAPTTAGLVKVIRFATTYDSSLPLSIAAAAEGSGPKRRRSRVAGGQGFEQDSEVRQAVEEYAMVQAERHYAGWDTHRRDKEKLGYDIELRRGRERVFVEVKGTRTSGERVILTRNEVRHAHKDSHRSVLFVVAKIAVVEVKGAPVCSGGEVSIYERWDPEARKSLLTVKDYWYKLPAKTSARYEVE